LRKRISCRHHPSEDSAAFWRTGKCDSDHRFCPSHFGTIIPAMARRSLGVVFIVALLGWTVNQPTLGCQGSYSRAAVVVLAGASPAHQPEPSPSRHNCCPHESEEAKTAQPASAAHCSSVVSMNHDCCSVSGDINRDLPPGIVKGSPFVKFVVLPSSPFKPLAPAQASNPVRRPAPLLLPQHASNAVLRL
jgi:hypothetical protein